MTGDIISVIVYVLIIFLAVIGFAYIIMKLTCDFLTSDSECVWGSAILLNGKSADVDLRLMLERYRWSDSTQCTRPLWVVDTGLSTDIAESCRSITEKYDFAIYIYKSDFMQMIEDFNIKRG